MVKFSIKKRIRSFRYAFEGILETIRYEHNVWIHLIVAGITIISGFCIGINPEEWIAIGFAIAIVLITEWINTAIEHLSDALSTEKNDWVKKAKDAAAGAVLIAAILAIFVGLMVFIPYL